MAVKTITIDLEAYEILSRHKRKGQSFSQVIKERLGTARKGRDLLRALAELELGPSTLDATDQLIAKRHRDSARAVPL